MRAPISVIIPTLNAAESLPGCIATLMEGLEAGLICELILTDGGSTDATHKIADSAGAEWITGSASRGGQLRRGVDMARGNWVLVLHADSRLSPGWTTVVTAALQQPGAYWGHLRFDSHGLMAGLIARWANLRSGLFGLPYGDQGLLIDLETYQAAGGYPDIPLMEDVALAKKLRAMLKPLGSVVTTSAAKYQRQGWIRRGGRNLLTLLRYLMGADPEKLATAYKR